MCTSENRLGQTVQTGQQALGHLEELFSEYVRGPTPNKIPDGMCLYQAMMTLHFLNDIVNDAESIQK